MKLLLLLLLTLLNAQKLALLIGNSNYQYLQVLSFPSQDIPALAKKLRSMDFDVTELYDLDEKQMKKAIESFQQKLYQNPNAIALFYYSGHGSQAYGESYLIPVDGDTRDESDVEADGVKVEGIAKKMAKARTKANILFLDACRDVPTGTMGGTKGLGQVKRQPSATLILYSTSKNKTANDDRVFNQTVLEKLALNMPFSSLANDISYAVGQKTSRQQVPELLSTGLPTVCLNRSCQQQELKVVEKIIYRDRPKDSTPIVTSQVDSLTKDITILNGKMWQNKTIEKSSGMDAYNYCANLQLAKYSDWRVPTKDELHRLRNKYYKLFSDEYYWSSTSNGAFNYWVVGRYSDSFYKEGNYFQVRCLRDIN